MIHERLTPTRPLVIPDTETTGTDVKNDRIIELAFQVWTADGLQKEYRTLVNPGVPILNSVTGKHGITDEAFVLCRTCNAPLAGGCCMAPRGWPTFAQLAPSLLVGFKNCDYAGKNVRFDLRILTAEFARAGIPWSIGDARIVDADRLEALLNKRSLSHLYRKYVRVVCPACGGGLNCTSECKTCHGKGEIGKKLEGAHGALTDVKASAEVIVAQMDAVTQNEDEAVPLPRDLDALHALQFPGMIDLDGKFQFVDGVPCFSFWGKYANRPMTVADVGYWDFIIKNDFSAEVKALAGNAKLGKFPEVKA